MKVMSEEEFKSIFGIPKTGQGREFEELINDVEFQEYYKVLNSNPYYTKLSDEDRLRFQEFSKPMIKMALHIASKHPFSWGKWVCGINPYDYQFKMLDSMHKYKFLLFNTSRQIGKSLVLGIFAFWAAYNNVHPVGIDKRTKVGIVSATEDQAKKLLKDIYTIVQSADGVFAKLTKGTEFSSRQYFTQKMREKPTAYKLDFNGGSIECFPPTKKLRGNSLSFLLIDEGDFLGCEDPNYFFNSEAMPTLKKTDGNAIISSTPKGTPSYYQDIFRPYEDSPATGWHRIWYNWTIYQDDWVNGWRRYKQALEQGKLRDFEAEYEAKFTSGRYSFFTPEKIDKCTANRDSIDECYEYTYAGVDFGSVTSRTAVTLAYYDKQNEKSIILHSKEFPQKYENDKLVEYFNRIKQRYRIHTIICESCLDEDTLVVMADLSRKKIKDIKQGESILSYDFKKNKYRNIKVKHKYDTGFQKTYKIDFRNGTSVYATKDHKWFVKNRRNDKLSVVTTENLDPKKYYIPVSLNIPKIGEDIMTKDENYILGMYIAEGCKHHQGYQIIQYIEENKDKIRNALKNTNFIWTERKSGFWIKDALELKHVFEDVGKYSYNKIIPEYCFKQSKELLESLYEGLFDGDGYRQAPGVDKRGYNYGLREGYSSTSKHLSEDIRYLGLLLNKPMHASNRIHSGFGSKRIQYEPVYRENSFMCEGKLFIKSITEDKIRHTYDLDIPETHSFILSESNIITHNCPAGDTPIALLKRAGFRVIEFNSKADKIKSYENMQIAVNNERVEFYQNKTMLSQLKGLEAVETNMGNTQIHKPKGMNDDVADSVMFAISEFIKPKKKGNRYIL